MSDRASSIEVNLSAMTPAQRMQFLTARKERMAAETQLARVMMQQQEEEEQDQQQQRHNQRQLEQQQLLRMQGQPASSHRTEPRSSPLDMAPNAVTAGNTQSNADPMALHKQQSVDSVLRDRSSFNFNRSHHRTRRPL